MSNHINKLYYGQHAAETELII